MHATGIFGHVAADAAGHLAGGVWGVIKAIAGHRPRHPAVDHTGLHRDALVFQVYGQHLAHATGGDHQGLDLGYGAAGEAGAAAPGHKRHPLLVAELYRGSHLGRRLRQHHQGRLVPAQGEAIAVVGQQLLARRHHGPGWQELA